MPLLLTTASEMKRNPMRIRIALLGSASYFIFGDATS